MVLAVPNVPTMPATDFRVVRYRPWSLFGLVRAADVVICQGFRFPLAALQLSGRIVVIDLYDPIPLERSSTTETRLGVTRSSARSWPPSGSAGSVVWPTCSS